MARNTKSSPEPKDARQQAAYVRELYIQELERRLAEAQANLRALAAAHIDGILESGRTTPLLLREAQASLQRSKEELEQKVAERTTELLAANARLLEMNRELAAREEELRASEKKYSDLIKYAPAGIYSVDFHGRRFTSVNDVVCELSGYSHDEMMGMNPMDILDDEGKSLFLQRIDQWMKGEEPEENVEYRIKTKDGRIVHVLLDVSFTRDDAGNPLGATVIAVDITARRLAEEALKESEHRFRTMADGTPVIIWVHDVTGRLEFINRAWSEFFGLTLEEALGEWQPLVHPDDTATYSEVFMECLRVRKPFRAQARVRRYDGEWRWIDSFGQPRFSDSGEFHGMAGSSLDITEQKQAQEELLRSQNEISRLVNTSYEGIWSVDTSGSTTFVNQRAAEILGYTLEEIKMRSAFEFLMPADVEAGRQTLEMIMAGRSGLVEAHARRKDGSQAVLWTSYSPIIDEQGEFQGALAMFSDITERKQIEEALQLSDARLRVALSHAGLIVFSQDREQRYTWIYNPHPYFKDILGKTDADLLGEESAGALAEIKQRVLDTGEGAHQELLIPIGEANQVFDLVIEPVFDPSGEVTGILCSSLDITERKRAEEAIHAYALKLERSNRDLEDFAFVASHDLKEPLRKVQTFGGLLKERHGRLLGEDGREYVERMQNATERMQYMIDDLLAYSRIATQRQSFQQTDLNAVAQEVIDDLEARIAQSRGQIELQDLPVIEAEPMQMHQLLQNLISNSLKFQSPESKPFVRVGVKNETTHSIELFVEDNGIGFDVSKLERIFQPFQRLHGRKEYDGSGIGLAICRKIVERHNGSITAESTPGKGTTFFITLPVHQNSK